MSKIVSHQMYVNKQTLPTSLGHSSNILDTPIPPSGPSLRAVTSWTMDPYYFHYLPSLYTSPTPPKLLVHLILLLKQLILFHLKLLLYLIILLHLVFLIHLGLLLYTF